ncbi:aminoglycoside phosphotransferase family protein [Serinicoccus kebangsaanensis]|uniref:aminoglycoside phosphotransferase family protein n=1 Tax=Serinicoccus kebangsaanensis TaxID=2602069 RepID=UPI00124F686E|nr:aminoglycoside phosphotransferase family protein [Serinicoccus kebangsaanensis]
MTDLVPGTFTELLLDRPADAVLGALPRAAGRPTPVDGATWLRRLPGLVDDLLGGWRLTVDGPSRHGECALVVPVRRHTGEPAALKVTWPHTEARHEHLALRAWDGQGAVRLLAAEPTSSALLLERLDADRCLRDQPLLEACEVIGRLMTELDRPATPQLDTVEDRAQRWAGQLAEGSTLVPRRLTEQATSTLAGLLGDAPDPRLVHEDLHDLNVLAPLPGTTDRGDWLAIDPKPLAAEWAYAVAPVVWNRAEEAARASNLRTHARLRADVVADAAGLDEDRVRAWTFVRLVLNSVWAAPHAPASDDFRARMIALAKAFAD